MRAATWFSISLATALAAHAAIDLLASISGGHAHEDYAHVTVFPLLVTACALAGLLVSWSALRRIAVARGIDPVRELATRFESASPLISSAGVTLGGFAILVAMEFAEQFESFGRVRGVADALGGNAILGFVLLAAIGSIATVLFLRCANAIVGAAAATIATALSWFSRRARSSAVRTATDGYRRARNRSLVPAAFVRSFGLRAPPQ